MPVLEISEETTRLIEQESDAFDMPVDSLLVQALRHLRTVENHKRIGQEQAWWLSQPLSVRAKYEGEYVAVHNQLLIDHDKDRVALHDRIRAKFGNKPVLVMPAEGPREVFVRSPRIVR
jgi:hypothetical protein